MTGGQETSSQLKLGINGFGRVGKLTLWHHVARKYFSEIIVNIGRRLAIPLRILPTTRPTTPPTGRCVLFCTATTPEPVIGQVNPAGRSMVINGVPVRFLSESRDPARIAWKDNGVRLVIDATGKFLDPTKAADSAGGSCLGHLEAGAEKVLVTAPFKIKDKAKGHARLRHHHGDGHQ